MKLKKFWEKKLLCAQDHLEQEYHQADSQIWSLKLRSTSYTSELSHEHHTPDYDSEPRFDRDSKNTNKAHPRNIVLMARNVSWMLKASFLEHYSVLEMTNYRWP